MEQCVQSLVISVRTLWREADRLCYSGNRTSQAQPGSEMQAELQQAPGKGRVPMLSEEQGCDASPPVVTDSSLSLFSAGPPSRRMISLCSMAPRRTWNF